MRIKNLYIGNIHKVEKIEFDIDECYWDIITKIYAPTQRKTILYRKDDNSDYVVDLIGKGKYPIGASKNLVVGDVFADTLVSCLSSTELMMDTNKMMSRRKILKKFKEKLIIMQPSIEETNEENIYSISAKKSK